MRRALNRLLAIIAVTVSVVALTPGMAQAAIPTVPTSLAAAATNKAVVLTWVASSNVPTDYVIEYSADGFVVTTIQFMDGTSTAVTATVTGLTNGTTYSFRVKGFNGEGTSAASSVVTAIPYSDHTQNDLALFDACPASAITSSGFTDTTSADVSCIKYYGITKGTTATTFSPLDFVSRWQMALFLTRMSYPPAPPSPVVSIKASLISGESRLRSRRLSTRSSSWVSL